MTPADVQPCSIHAAGSDPVVEPRVTHPAAEARMYAVTAPAFRARSAQAAARREYPSTCASQRSASSTESPLRFA